MSEFRARDRAFTMLEVAEILTMPANTLHVQLKRGAGGAITRKMRGKRMFSPEEIFITAIAQRLILTGRSVLAAYHLAAEKCRLDPRDVPPMSLLESSAAGVRWISATEGRHCSRPDAIIIPAGAIAQAVSAAVAKLLAFQDSNHRTTQGRPSLSRGAGSPLSVGDPTHSTQRATNKA